MAHTFWTKEEIITLIEKYRALPSLWNVKLSEYKNRMLREDAYKSISSHFPNYDVEMVKSKIQTLRGQHRKQLSALKKSVRSGAGTDDVTKPSLWCFKELSLINDDVKQCLHFLR